MTAKLPDEVQAKLLEQANQAWDRWTARYGASRPVWDTWLVDELRAAAAVAVEHAWGAHPLANVYRCSGKQCQAAWIKRPIGREDINCSEAREHGWLLDTTNGVNWWCPNCKGEPEGQDDTKAVMQAEIDHYRCLYVESAADQVELAKNLDKAESELTQFRAPGEPTTERQAMIVCQAWHKEKGTYLDAAAEIDKLIAKAVAAERENPRGDIWVSKSKLVAAEERHAAEITSIEQQFAFERREGLLKQAEERRRHASELAQAVESAQQDQMLHDRRITEDAVAAEREKLANVTREYEKVVGESDQMDVDYQSEIAALRERHAAELAQHKARYAEELAVMKQEFDEVAIVRFANGVTKANELAQKREDRAVRESRQAALATCLQIVKKAASCNSAEFEIRQLAAAEKPEQCPECIDSGSVLTNCPLCKETNQLTVQPYPCAKPPKQQGKLKLNCGGTVTR